ncbi:hypothetical protein NP233_g2000 [Leucocoprinus birnbaumii]|uniref:Uncharacterized protein n=1 Tax=Leucocoprinus birnbaumii TaxID=56174 RepID=A0AAD5YVA1_9AGAR|nr:hypothetical protein NP233_g2000 [Leucocoprinus birnbaumii]
MAYSYGPVCFGNDDIALRIVDLCSPGVLTAMMQVSSYTNGLVRTVVSGRVRGYLAPYFRDREDLEEFWDTLNETKSLICGSVALGVLDPTVLKAGGGPADLNILTPMMRVHDINDCLGCAGFYQSAIATVREGYKKSVFRFFVFRKGRLRITVSQSTTECALYPLANAATTHEMTALSSMLLFTLYPKHLDERISTHGILAPTDEDVERYNTKFDLDFKKRNVAVAGRGMCFEGCYGRWRRARGLHAVGKIGWGGLDLISDEWLTKPEKDKKMASELKQFASSHIRWRLKPYCTEAECEA